MDAGRLEAIPLPFEKIMSSLEMRVMSEIVRAIKINGFSTSTADWQMKCLIQMGKSEKEIKKWIQEAMDATDEELEWIYSDEVYQQYYGYKRAYDAKSIPQIPFEDNLELQILISAVKAQSRNAFKNITNSMGFAIKNPATGRVTNSPLTEFYRNTLSDAVMDIISGTSSYDKAISRAINTMTNSGLRWIDYESGWHNRVDVAARRAVMTGFRQVQEKMNEQVARELGTDFYEVSYHIGARPTHQLWQGRIYSYGQLVSVCGLGTVTGLHGANCYHDYNAFIPGVSVRTYTDEQLERMAEEENEAKSYNDKEYTTYEALQEQRKMERNMRKTRQDIKLLQEGDADRDTITIKKARYQLQMQQYKAFSEAMKLPEQIQRVYYDGLGRISGSSAALKRQEKAQAVKDAEKHKKEESKIRFSKFSDRFQTYNNGQKDIITYRRLLNNLNKTNIGRETVDYILEHPELDIQMYYNVDHDKDILGRQLGNEIRIYASETKTVQKTAETLIHEVAHHRYDIGGSQWAECVCKAQEIKHRNNRDELTGTELRSIIKLIRDAYPDLPWR